MNVKQFKKTASLLNIHVEYDTRYLSDAYRPGSPTSWKKYTGWWVGKQFLGTNKTEAFNALPDEIRRAWCALHQDKK